MRRLTIHSPSTTPGAPRCDELRLGADLWALAHPVPLEEWGDDARVETNAPRLVVRSGRSVTDAASSFATWSSGAWEDFLARVDRAVGACPCPLLLWPGPGSVLSDAVSTLSFARGRAGVGLLADPAAWVTGPMLGDAADHLDRFARALALCDAVRGVVVRPIPDAGLDADAAGAALDPLLDRVGVRLDAPALATTA